MNAVVSIAAVVIIAGLTILALEVFVSVVTAVFWLSFQGWKAAWKWLRR